MSECAKGCGRPAKIRGWCRNHYNAQLKYAYNRQRWARTSSVGISRRLQALVAIGYPNHYLSDQLGIGPSYVSKLMHNGRRNVNADTATRVKALYDRLSMTPGPSWEARERARKRGWVPPLAWDDDAIDDPQAVPNVGDSKPVTWAEKYQELRFTGLSDLQILDRLGVNPESMLRQMDRYGITADPELVRLAIRRKHARAATT